MSLGFIQLGFFRDQTRKVGRKTKLRDGHVGVLLGGPMDLLHPMVGVILPRDGFLVEERPNAMRDIEVDV